MSSQDEDYPSPLESFKDFKEFLMSECTALQWQNIHIHTRMYSRNKLSRYLTGAKKWDYNDLLAVLDFIQTPILPTEIIRHFNLKNEFSEYQLRSIDHAIFRTNDAC